MINFPSTGIKLGGIDVMTLFATVFQILMDKKLVTENEIIGALTKAGFTFTRTLPEPANNPAIDLTKHERECLCEGCQKSRGLQ